MKVTVMMTSGNGKMIATIVSESFKYVPKPANTALNIMNGGVKNMKLIPKYKVSLVEDKGQHRYTVNDDPTFLPGVTEILDGINKPFLLQWVAKETALYMQKMTKKFFNRSYNATDWDLLIRRAKLQHRFIKETAARKGSHAHKIINDYLSINDKPTIEPNFEFGKSFFHWIKTNKLKIIAGDTKVASLIHGYGGSLDAITEENGRVIVLDFKTGKNLHETHAYQIASYSYALKETYSLSYLPDGYVIRFEKDKAKYEIRKIRDIHDSFKAFKAALDLYNAQQLIHFTDREIVKEKNEKNNFNEND